MSYIKLSKNMLSTTTSQKKLEYNRKFLKRHLRTYKKRNYIAKKDKI